MIKTKLCLLTINLGYFYKSRYFNAIFFKGKTYIVDSEFKRKDFYKGLLNTILDNHDKILDMVDSALKSRKET